MECVGIARLRPFLLSLASAAVAMTPMRRSRQGSKLSAIMYVLQSGDGRWSATGRDRLRLDRVRSLSLLSFTYITGGLIWTEATGQ